MPRMQVTFNDLKLSPANLDFPENLSTLMFQIEYRGKCYDCVGHVRRSYESAELSGSSEIMFSGYHGYNGPIDIQELRSAAIDYYRSVTGDNGKEQVSVSSGREFTKRLQARLQADRNQITDKSYEFNVGSIEQQVIEKAS
ncbi:MAG: hypothetical protein KJN90_00295 [Gammaproteobacteria bacterium]|nr:hypothetical protein [Gammaproteobacteria bacterium]